MDNWDEETRIKLAQTIGLIESMVAELRFRGCDDNHKLIRQAHELRLWLKQQHQEKSA